MTSAEATRSARSRVFRASAVGGVLAGLLFTWMLTAGHADLTRSHPVSNLYDAQAHSLLDLRWDIPRGELGIEAIVIDGKSYMYYGPWPAFLRVPVAALTDRFDGELTSISMLLAFVVLLVAATRLGWRVRELARGDAPLARWELGVAGAFTFVLGAGSIVLFLASRAWVYSEAELWGAALSIAAYDQIVAFLTKPGRRPLAWAGVLSALAFLSRASVGLGPIVALGLVLAGRLLVMARARFARRPLRWFGLPTDPQGRSFLPWIAVAVAAPLVLYAYVNYSRFGHPFRVPFTHHVTLAFDEARQAAFAANGGSFFGLQFVPTNIIAFARPDALRLDALFPWVTFPPDATVVGDATFDTLDLSSSIPATMPALTILGVVGIVAIVRARQQTGEGPDLSALRTPVAGALVGGGVTLTIAFVAHRYLSDFLPLLVLCSLAGLQALLRRLDGGSRPRWRGVVVAGLVIACVASVWVNLSLGLLYQRSYNASLSDAERAAFVGFQRDVDRLIPGGSRFRLRQGTELPAPGEAGDLFVVRNCDGLYLSDGSQWNPVERTNATGRYRFRVTFPRRAPGTREPIVAAGQPAATDVLGVEYRDNDRVAFLFAGQTPGDVRVGQPQRIEPGKEYTLDVLLDPRPRHIEVRMDGDGVFGWLHSLPSGPVRFGEAAGHPAFQPRFTGRLDVLPVRAELCSQLLRDTG
jgi:hypothetical protein